ncbi:MAG: GMC family oxidoreductase [Acidobacteria bacterium]|nr:GMC family oxidoreductase [Acidobacteriota bacterium]MBI3655893.1 GMC family oxidoreductase [Acidobacteriota bacterium]
MNIWTPEQIHSEVREQCDVCVVGTGAGGAVSGAILAQAGLDVLFLEEGPMVKTEAFSSDARRSIPTLYRHSGITPIAGRRGSRVIFSEGRCVGGSTVLNAGICYRTPRHVLEQWQTQEGLKDFGPEGLDPYFQQVEQRISVQEVPRAFWSRDTFLLEEGAKRLGWHTTPIKRNIRLEEGAASCLSQCSTLCTQGCPTATKQSALITYMEDALAAGARLYTGARAESVLTEPLKNRRQARGVQGWIVDRNGKTGKRAPIPFHVQAKAVVLAGGAIQTPHLLFRSGLSTRNGQVGQNLYLHPNTKIIGLFDEPIEAWRGSIQGLQVDQFADEGCTFFITFLPPGIMAFGLPMHGEPAYEVMQQYRHLAHWGVLIEDTHSGAVLPARGPDPNIRYDITPADRERILTGIERLATLFFSAGARRLLLPLKRLHEIRQPEEVRKIKGLDPPVSDIDLFTVHAMGTCRMSASVARGVVNPSQEHFEVDRLFISDASVFPGPTRVNPMLTIMALATRAATNLLQRTF